MLADPPKTDLSLNEGIFMTADNKTQNRPYKLPEEAKSLPEENPLAGALRISPAKMQEFLRMMSKRKGGHSEARALRAKARIAKRKAKRK